MSQESTVAKGLEGIEVDETAISLVEGAKGRLSYRGIPLDVLVHWPFTRVVLLVLNGDVPDDGSVTAFEAELAQHSVLTSADTVLLDLLAERPMHPMQVLVAMAAAFEHPPGAFAAYGEAARGCTVAAKLPAATARLFARRHGGSLPTANVAATRFNPVTVFLRGIGAPPDEKLAHAMEVTQILQIEHSFNAGTFAARVVASSLAPVENCIAGAIATLHGVLHGGADQAALETAYRVGAPENAAAFVDACLARGDKVMGMGHREYKVLDPRAVYVRQFAEELARGGDLETVARTLMAIEDRFTVRMREKNKPLYANLEFYKGIVYAAAGLTPDFFTATFATARVWGYVAHFIESRRDNRIIRPSARYVGRMPPEGDQ
jgi:citrate synthase